MTLKAVMIDEINVRENNNVSIVAFHLGSTKINYPKCKFPLGCAPRLLYTSYWRVKLACDDVQIKVISSPR